MSIDLVFTTDMALGVGKIYITDGAMKTVIDPATGLPALRIAGATDTQVVAASSIHISGTHVLIDGLNLKPGHAYSILMEPGALASTSLRPFAAVTNPTRISFGTPAAADEAPTLLAIETSGPVLSSDSSLTLTLRFSEAVTGLTTAAISAPGAVLSDLRSADGVTWTVKLAAATANVETSGTIGVNLGAVRDATGHAAVASGASASYMIDTRAPTLASIDLDGASLGGSQAIGVTFTFSEAVADLSPSAISAPHASVSGLHTIDDGHTWQGLLGTSDTSSSTGNVLTVDMSKVHDLAGNAGSGTTSSGTGYDITEPPAGIEILSPASGSTINVGEALVITFNEAVFLDPEGDYDEIGVISKSTGITSHVFIDERNFSGDHKTLTIRADDLHLDSGSDYNIVLPYWLNDGHATPLGENETAVHTTGSYTDTTAPTALYGEAGTSSSWYGDSYGAGTEITIRIRFSEPVQVVDGQSPSITLDNGGIATYARTSDDHRELVFVYTVGAGDRDSGRLDVSDTSGLAGKLEDMHGNRIDAAHIQFSHLANSYGDVAIDTHAPSVLTGAVLDASSDSGSLNNDALTKDSTPTLRGTGAEPGALEIRIYDDGSVVGYGYADSDGTWWATVTESHPLLDGVHNLTVTQVDQSGNESPVSAAVPVTIKTAAPASLAAPLLAIESDTGLFNNDGITTDNTPTFSGVGAEAFAAISLFSGSTGIGQTTADSDGHWTITSNALGTAGIHLITAKQVDQAGNQGPASSAFKLSLLGGSPPSLTATYSVVTGGDFVLKFSDLISVTTSVGDVVLTKGVLPVRTILPTDALWMVESDGTHEYTVLKIPGLADGSYHLDFLFSSPVNLVGIAATGLLANDLDFTVGPS
jgi:hypothetical protein